MKRSVAVIFFGLFIICMIVVVMHLSPVGDPHLPGYADFISPDVPASQVSREANSVALRYNRGSIPDGSSISVVGGVILDYRGYDTLYETTVIFTALISVLSVLSMTKGKGGSDAR